MTVTKEEYNKITEQVKQLREEEKDLVIANMPKFERGIIEAALEREHVFWKELYAVFKKYSITPSIITTIKSDNQPSSDPHRPALACAGVQVTLTYIVSPMDKSGKDGSLPGKVLDEIAEIREKTDKLTRQLEEV